MKLIVLVLLVLLTSCIQPQNYHPGASSTAAFSVPQPNTQRPRAVRPVAYEAYIEFDARGQLFDSGQITRAVNMIQALKHPTNAPERPVSLFLFIHGWKNNAAESSGNVWGFRQLLRRQANTFDKEPVIGVYIGWPGNVTNFGQFFSFWNRESVANSVGGGDLDDVLRKLLTATKGSGYEPAAGVPASSAILIGHSMGGLVLERSAIRILREQLEKCAAGQSIAAPADLIVLLNEAAPASLARSFLIDLLKEHVEYKSDGSEKSFPLIAALTSDGDAATKIALPGSEFISPSRTKTVPFPASSPDVFGQKTSLPYNLLSPANMMALRSHEILTVPSTQSNCLISTTVHKRFYCVSQIDPKPVNTTPYWIMGLPQIFVPDHSTIFRNEMLELVDAFIGKQTRKSTGEPRGTFKLYKGTS